MAAMASGERLAQLRACMKNERHVKEPLAAYIVLTDDAHQVSRSGCREHLCIKLPRSHVQSECIELADCDKRRQFLSGFTGSAGKPVPSLVI